MSAVFSMVRYNVRYRGIYLSHFVILTAVGTVYAEHLEVCNKIFNLWSQPQSGTDYGLYDVMLSQWIILIKTSRVCSRVSSLKTTVSGTTPVPIVRDLNSHSRLSHTITRESRYHLQSPQQYQMHYILEYLVTHVLVEDISSLSSFANWT
jgi:hypothetical protein